MRLKKPFKHGGAAQKWFPPPPPTGHRAFLTRVSRIPAGWLISFDGDVVIFDLHKDLLTFVPSSPLCDRMTLKRQLFYVLHGCYFE